MLRESHSSPFILLCELTGFSLEFTVGRSSRAVSKSGGRASQTTRLSHNTWQVFEFTCNPPLHTHTLRHIHAHAKEGNLPQPTMKLSFNHLFQTYRSSRGLSSLAKKSTLLYASCSAVPKFPLSVSSHPYTHHSIHHAHRLTLPTPCASPSPWHRRLHSCQGP